MGSNRKIVAGKGRAQVEISADLNKILNRVIDGSAKAVVEPMETETKKILSDATATGKPYGQAFPRRTGKAAEGFQYVLRVDPRGTIETVIQNPVKYVYYIKERRAAFTSGARGPQAWGKHVVKPGRKAARRLTKMLAKDLQMLATGKG